MKPTEEETKEMYLNWVSTECSCITNEIGYLFDNLPKEHKEQIAIDMKKHYNNKN